MDVGIWRDRDGDEEFYRCGSYVSKSMGGEIEWYIRFSEEI